MSDIVISKPKLLYENVLQLKNICYRNKEETQEVLNEENFMILSAMLLKKLLHDLHLEAKVQEKLTVLQNIHLHTACFEKHILGTTTIEQQDNPTLEKLIENVDEIIRRMQRKDTYCSLM